MYTRCPSCRAEISFEPPANAASLPEGYKHRIKCPSCGVTIGVKIPRVDAAVTIQPTYTTANPNATSFEPVYNATEVLPAAAAGAGKVKAAKKHGTGRNVIMLIISLLFVAVSIVGYLFSNGTIPAPPEGYEWLASFVFANGIDGWEFLCTGFTDFSVVVSSGANGAMTLLAPMILFALACINAIVAIISLIGKKYGRAYNVVSGTIMGAAACLTLFVPLFAAGYALELMGETLSVTGEVLKEYFTTTIIEGQQYMLIAVAALGIVQFILSLCFIKSLKIKQKN